MLVAARWFALSHMVQQVSLNSSFKALSRMARCHALQHALQYCCTSAAKVGSPLRWIARSTRGVKDSWFWKKNSSFRMNWGRG